MNAKPDPALERQREIFLRALEKPSPAEQAAYLDGACGDDLVLRAQVAALLQHHNADSFLERPPAGVESLQVGEGFVSEGPGSVIGRYKLLQKIGEGGMGVVYMAEQTEPVRRKVALKIIKLGMDTRQVIARFEAERQALALMDHPNIAKVLDAGATGEAEPRNADFPVGEKAAQAGVGGGKEAADRAGWKTGVTGRPYFVMDLVQGVPITEYCDKNHLSTPERLELFVPVCQAIHHAHQKGIIHRDIKPSNVMVTLHDGKPVPKVIDFGVAKAINQRLTEKTLFTHYATMIGTPAYMSPEQAEMSGLDVDTRTDVYALGVLLYELLTGTTPFPQKELLSVSYGEMQRIIAEKEPPKPSTRLSTLQGEERTIIAKNRSTEASALGKQCEGDLDWIVLKALEKDRTRRYETVNGLVADIHRHIQNEPVSAAAPTLAYQFQKFYRRRRLLVNATASLAALLVLGILATTWQAVRATRAEQRAEATRSQAVLERDHARTAEDTAKEERQRALEQQQRANAEADRGGRLLYIAHMNLANRAWDEGNLSLAAEFLDLHRPQPGQPDLRDFEWFYLDRVCRSGDLLTLKASTNSVWSVALSPDGKRLASAGDGNTVKVWDATNGQELLTFKGHTDHVSSVAFSPDGKRLASADGRGMVKVWDATSGQETLALEVHTNRPILGVAFSPDGKRLASAAFEWGKPAAVKVWDASTGQEMLTLKGHTNGITSVAFSPDGKRLASASWDRTVRVWDAASGQETLTLRGHTTGAATSVAFSPDGKRLASASWDRTVKVWDAASGQETLTLRGHVDGVWGVAFSADGSRLASASVDRTVKVWDATTGEEILTLKGHTREVFNVAFSPDGKRLTSASLDGTVKVWDTTRAREPLTLRGHTKWVGSVAFSPDGKRLASASHFMYPGPGQVKVWDATSGLEILRPEAGTNIVWYVRYSPDGKRLAAASQANTVKVWDADSGQETLTLRGHTDAIIGLAFSPEGKRLASACWDGTIKVWDITSGQETLTLKGHNALVERLAFSPDGNRLASASEDRTVKLWDVTTGQAMLTLKGHTSGVYDVAYSPDGRRVASASGDETIKVWDAASGQATLTLKGHNGAVGAIAFSPDGNRLASASDDRTVKLWDATTGQEILTLKGHAARVRGVAFSPDGKRLASCSDDQTVKVWDAQPRSQASTPEAKTR